MIRLVERLATSSSFFVVHVDKSASADTFDAIRKRVDRLAEASFIERRRCYRAHFSLAEVTLVAIDEALVSPGGFDYAILLSGQDYPIKSNEEIEQFFVREDDKLFLQYFRLPWDPWGPRGGLERIERWHVAIAGHIRSVPVRRRFPEPFQPFGGSHWWCLPRAAVEYVSRFARENARFVKFFKHVYLPEEIFFQTVLLNSRFREKAVNDNLKYMEWLPDDVELGEERGRPKTLRSEDFDQLASVPHLFARKFDVTRDADILDMIDERLLQLTGAAR